MWPTPLLFHSRLRPGSRGPTRAAGATVDTRVLASTHPPTASRPWPLLGPGEGLQYLEHTYTNKMIPGVSEIHMALGVLYFYPAAFAISPQVGPPGGPG